MKWFELCSFFSLTDNVSVCSRKYPKTLCLKGEKSKAAAASLQACVQYHLLYRAWWRHSVPTTAVGENGSVRNQPPTIQSHNGSASPAAETLAGNEAKSEASGVCVNAAMLAGCKISDADERSDFDAWVLLSEAHASHQATQRAVAEIQERLASMLALHSRAQGTEARTGESQVADASTTATTPTDPTQATTMPTDPTLISTMPTDSTQTSTTTTTTPTDPTQTSMPTDGPGSADFGNRYESKPSNSKFVQDSWTPSSRHESTLN